MVYSGSCFWKFASTGGFNLGLLRFYFEFNRDVLLGSTIRTDVWKKPVFSLNILLLVISVPCIFQYTCSVCFQGYMYISKKVTFCVPSWFALGLHWVFFGSTLETHIQPKKVRVYFRLGWVRSVLYSPVRAIFLNSLAGSFKIFSNVHLVMRLRYQTSIYEYILYIRYTEILVCMHALSNFITYLKQTNIV